MIAVIPERNCTLDARNSLFVFNALPATTFQPRAHFSRLETGRVPSSHNPTAAPQERHNRAVNLDVVDSQRNVCQELGHRLTDACDALPKMRDGPSKSACRSRLQCVTNAGVSLRCCTRDGSRPPEIGLQEQISNRPVRLRLKDVVVSDCGKDII